MRPTILEIPLPFEVFGSDVMPVRGFGLMVVLGLILGHWIVRRYGRKAGIQEDVLEGFFFVFVVSMLLGARLLYVIVNWDLYQNRPGDVFALHKGGMVYYGSLLGVAVALPVYFRAKRVPVLRTLDVCALGGSFGMFVGRIGCLLVGDDYGDRVSENFPLAIKFSTLLEDGSFLGITIPRANGNLAGPMQGEWLHPTQLYMSLNGLLLFFVLRWLWRRRRFDGQVLATFFMLYAVTRSIIEVFRGDVARGFVGPMSTSQFIGIFVLVAGAVLWWKAKRPDSGVILPGAEGLKADRSTTSG